MARRAAQLSISLLWYAQFRHFCLLWSIRKEDVEESQTDHGVSVLPYRPRPYIPRHGPHVE